AVAASGAVLLDRPMHARLPLWFPKALALTGVGVFAWLAVYGFLGQVRQLLIWLLIGLFLSFALEPAVNWLARHGWRRGVATAAGVLLHVAGAAAPRARHVGGGHRQDRRLPVLAAAPGAVLGPLHVRLSQPARRALRRRAGAVDGPGLAVRAGRGDVHRDAAA